MSRNRLHHSWPEPKVWMLARYRISWSLHTLALQNAASAAHAGARTRELVWPRESRRPIAEVLAQRESRKDAALGQHLAYPAETRGAESRSHPTPEGSRTLWSFVSLRCCQRAAACAVLRPPAWRGWRPALRSKTARPHRGPPPCGPRLCAVSGARARFKRSQHAGCSARQTCPREPPRGDSRNDRWPRMCAGYCCGFTHLAPRAAARSSRSAAVRRDTAPCIFLFGHGLLGL